MENLVVGSEALRSGVVSGYQLRTLYRTVYPDVYVPAFTDPTMRTRTAGAWLWSDRRAVVAGLAAAALHASLWIDEDVPVELIWRNTHPPDGLIVRNERLATDEITRVAGIPVTTRARTAFDLGRYLSRDEAIARLDALMRASPFSVEDVLLLAKRYRGARGLKALQAALPLIDGGAASPQETRLRLLFVDAGLPKPTTQVPVCDHRGRLIRMLDMGWEDYMVAAEYDGDQHRTNRAQYVKDARVLPKLERMGWNVIRVIKEDPDDHIIERARTALVSRGWTP
jgi:hypothetical protein